MKRIIESFEDFTHDLSGKLSVDKLKGLMHKYGELQLEPARNYIDNWRTSLSENEAEPLDGEVSTDEMIQNLESAVSILGGSESVMAIFSTETLTGEYVLQSHADSAHSPSTDSKTHTSGVSMKMTLFNVEGVNHQPALLIVSADVEGDTYSTPAHTVLLTKELADAISQ